MINSRPQLLLQQIGIQQWIPRSRFTIKKSSNVLWQDQQQNDQTHTEQIITPIKYDQIIKPTIQEKLEKNIQKEEVEVKSAIINPITEIEPITTQDIKFNYDILVHDQFILCAEIFQQAERRLFHNIEKACVAQHYTLTWPIPIQHWDASDHFLQSFLRGFFAIHQQKKLIVLGEITILEQINNINQMNKFPTLQQLITSAEQKRALWQFLYPLVYDVE